MREAFRNVYELYSRLLLRSSTLMVSVKQRLSRAEETLCKMHRKLYTRMKVHSLLFACTLYVYVKHAAVGLVLSYILQIWSELSNF